MQDAEGTRMVEPRQTSRRSTGQRLLALLIACAGVAGVFVARSAAQAPPPTLALTPLPHRSLMTPLLTEARVQRAQYWFSRRGLQFGVPPGAYDAAVTHMYKMKTRPSGGMGAINPRWNVPTWDFIGPQPMLDVLPNFGGVIVGATFNATGRISAIAADPTTPGRLFVGAANGGVWMSADGGSTFTPIGDALPTQAIGAIVLDPVNTSPPTIYVATGEAHNSLDSYYGQGLFQSTDLGATWTPLAPGTFDRTAFAQLAIDTSQNPPILFAATGTGVSGSRATAVFIASDLTKNGLWRSSDGGNSWTQYAAATFRCGLSPNPST